MAKINVLTAIAPATTAINEAPVVDVATAPATDKPAELTLEQQVEKADADILAASTEMMKQTIGSKEFIDHAFALTKLQNERNKLDAKIASAANARKLEDEKNARVAMLTDYRAAIVAGNTEAEKVAYDKLSTELLAKYATSTAANTAAPRQTGNGGERGAIGKRIVEKFLAERAKGLNDTDAIKAVIASGESRGTTGAVILAWQRENGEKS